MQITKRRSDPLMNIKVVFEDKDILVLDKPAGMLVLPDRYDPTIPNLQKELNTKYGRIYVVHRIDKETSGVVVFAKTEDSHRFLNGQFESRTTKKKYLAICLGEMQKEEDRIDLALSEDPSRKGRMKIDPAGGKSAGTTFRVLERFAGFSFVEVIPETGRTHQIRVHLKAAGLPILSDSLYGGGEGFFLSQIKKGYRVKGEEKPLLERTALHASTLTFEHPSTKQPMTFEAEVPKDMRIVLNYLRRFRGR